MGSPPGGPQREIDSFQRAGDNGQREADFLQRRADVLQGEADILQRAADILQRRADIFQRRADVLQRAADVFSGQLTSFSGELTTFSGKLTRVSVKLTVASGEVTRVSVRLTAASGEVTRVSVRLTVVSGEVTRVSVRLTAVSGKVTRVSVRLTSISMQVTPVGVSLTAASALLTESNWFAPSYRLTVLPPDQPCCAPHAPYLLPHTRASYRIAAPDIELNRCRRGREFAVTEVRFGLIGCGGIGRWHAKCLASIPGAKLVGVTDSNPEAVTKAVALSGAQAFSTVDSLLAEPAMDIVTICTPPDSHSSLIAAAAGAGKHVVVEKPLAPTLAEADHAIASCAAAAVQLGVVHQQRARSASQAVRRLIADGTLGKPVLASVTHTWYRTQQQFDREAWRGGHSAGGGFLLDQCIHAVDLLVWLLGQPRWVSAATSALVLQKHGEDTLVATVEFESGALGTIAASTAANGARDDIALDFAGTAGSFRLELRDYDHAEIVALSLADSPNQRARPLSASEIESVIQRELGEWRRGPRSLRWRLAAALAGSSRGAHPFRSPRAWLRRQADRAAQADWNQPQGHAAILTQMAAVVRGEGTPMVTGRDARRSLAVLDAINRSEAAGGGRVTVSREGGG